MLTACALLLILQALVASAKVGWRENCHHRPSVVCDGVRQRMSRKDCEAGYEFLYCAKSGLLDEDTGEWHMRNAEFSTHHPIAEERCMVIGDREIRVVLPNDENVDIYDMISICEYKMAVRDQKKAKRRPKRIHFVAQPTTTTSVPVNYTTAEPSSQSDLEQQLFAALTVQNAMFINAMAIFVFVIVIAIRRPKNNETIPFYYDDIPTNPECDGAVYTPCVQKVNTISNPSFVE